MPDEQEARELPNIAWSEMFALEPRQSSMLAAYMNKTNQQIENQTVLLPSIISLQCE
jgi:hypothetical protein